MLLAALERTAEHVGLNVAYNLGGEDVSWQAVGEALGTSADGALGEQDPAAVGGVGDPDGPRRPEERAVRLTAGGTPGCPPAALRTGRPVMGAYPRVTTGPRPSYPTSQRPWGVVGVQDALNPLSDRVTL